ncbi:hypothetical protein [Flavobacterium tegetincola]|uniref:hypothetical protein n=1 Tax=Flavobacterium tegetincola TaxID=150172 RepID=UPI000403491F|nr:hypothetical protein [Flavobacterium tegetincola]
MEQNNIENQFRDKLNSREIKPSENSWDRLDAMLTVVEKPKKNYRWMFFAASFLGFIIIATVFLNQTEEVIDSEHQKVVLQDVIIENNENDLEKENNLENLIEKPVEQNATAIVSIREKAVVKQTDKEALKVKSNPLVKKEKPVQIALSSENEIIKKPINSQKTEVKVDANSLLASVENNHSSKSKNDPVALSVNTAQLLSQVDGELELSFREKVIKSVNKTYKEVKIAVTKRNLE